jgi:hypothetical protein
MRVCESEWCEDGKFLRLERMGDLGVLIEIFWSESV